MKILKFSIGDMNRKNFKWTHRKIAPSTLLLRCPEVDLFLEVVIKIQKVEYHSYNLAIMHLMYNTSV